MKICYVTEINLDKKLGGAITNDLKTINILKKLGEVDVIHLETEKYKTTWLAFPIFMWQILRSSRSNYQAYFSRGLIASYLLLLLKPIHRRKIIHNALSVPFPSIETRYSYHNVLFKFTWFCLMRFLEHVVTQHVDAVVVAAETYANQVFKNGVTRRKVHVVPFYVEDRFFQQAVRPRAGAIFVFGYSGGFHPYHGLSTLIEAFENLSQKNPRLRLYLVGVGPMRQEVEREVTIRKLTRTVKFLGRLPHSSVPNFLSSVDSFIILTSYGLSTSLLEAAAVGKPIITLKRRQDSTLEHYFRDGKEILLAEDSSPEKIAMAMKLISEDAGFRDKLAHGARKVAEEYFSPEASLRQYEKLIQETLPSATSYIISALK